MIEAIKRGYAAVKHCFQVTLIEDVKDYWRFWSVRFGWTGIAITSYLVMSADALILAWQTMPEEFKQFIPPQWMPMIGVVVFVASMIARGFKQKKLEKPNPDIEVTDAGIVDHE